MNMEKSNVMTKKGGKRGKLRLKGDRYGKDARKTHGGKGRI